MKKHYQTYCSLLFLFFYSILFFSACSNESNLEIIEQELFVKIYTEMVLLSLSNTKSDTLENLHSALDKYNVTQEKFYATKAYFESKPELWLEVFTKIEDELKEIESGSQKEESKTERKGK